MLEALKTEPLEEDEVYAIRELYKGTATEYQQRLALRVIVNKLCRSHDLLYVPGSFDETALLNGRAFVGQAILKILNVPIGKLLNKQEGEKA